MPLRGTRRLRLRITSPSSGRSKRARALARCSGSSGRNLSVSTPGGTTVTGSDRPAARSASSAGYPPAAITSAAPRSTRPSWRPVIGSRPGTVTSAPWSTTP